MEQATEQMINLFADELPSMEVIKKLSDFVHSSEKNKLDFTVQLEQNLSKTSDKAVLAAGIGLYIIGKYNESVEKLQKVNDCKEKFIYLGLALRQVGRFDEAVESFQKSLLHGADQLSVSMEKVSTYRQGGNFQAAENMLKEVANFENVSAEFHYQRGRLKEQQGFYEEAVGDYRTALELVPNHQMALFHLAYRCDLSGDEDAAIDYYKQVVSESPVSVSALLNLAVVYEDLGKYEKASKCIDKVLMYHPNHQRAILFKKDIESSKTMIYDEEKEKKKDHKNKLLETPISDFELSVRSRNCLRKMKIRTIGDLLNISEAELLSYKNFGETSLKEIKGVLEQKGLYLGMALEDRKKAESEKTESEQDEQDSMLNKLVDDLQLSVRSRKCLQGLNLRTIDDLTKKTEAELLGFKNFGVTSLNEIKKALQDLGLSLRQLE